MHKIIVILNSYIHQHAMTYRTLKLSAKKMELELIDPQKKTATDKSVRHSVREQPYVLLVK